MTVRSNHSEGQPTRVELGYVAGAHALKGELRVRWLGDGPENLLCAEFVWLGESRGDSAAPIYKVRDVGSGRHGEVRLKLEGVEDRTAAEGLRGRVVMVEASQLAPLADDEYYWHELIGFRVETLEGQLVGEVVEMWDTGGHDLLVVRGESGPQKLIPTAREIMKKVNPEQRLIVIDALPGLIDGTE